MDILLISVILILLSYIKVREVRKKKEIENLMEQLDFLIKEVNTNTILKTVENNSDLNPMIVRMNELIRIHRKREVEFIQKELKYKEGITNISHDLRTPLTAIKGYAGLLKKDLNMEKRDKYLNIIDKKINTIVSMVDIFYEISRYESEDYVINKERINLSEEVENTILENYMEFEKKSMEIIYNKPGKDEFIDFDLKSLSRILNNIFQNAIRYGDEYLKISIEKEKERTVLLCENKGLDDSVDDVSKVFERTFTLDPSRSKGGTGLGLYIIKILCEMNGAKTEALNREGNFLLKITF